MKPINLDTARGAARAARAARAAAADADSYLTLSANLAFDVLREMNAPGVALWDQLEAEGK